MKWETLMVLCFLFRGSAETYQEWNVKCGIQTMCKVPPDPSNI